MKKKIFSTLLMGAFFLASMSMFTSCKDYDDDINKNKSEIEALKTQIATLDQALQGVQQSISGLDSKYAAKSYEQKVDQMAEQIKNFLTAQEIEKLIADAKEELQKAIDGKADKADLQKLSEKVDGIDTNLNTLSRDVDGIKSALNDPETGLAAAHKQIALQQEAIDELKKALKGESSIPELNNLYNQVKDNTEKIGKLREDLDKLRSEFDTFKAEATADIADLKSRMLKAEEAIDQINSKISMLTLYIDKMLTSMVTKTDYMLNGIETLPVHMLHLQPSLGSDYKDKRGAADETWSVLKRKDFKGIEDYHDIWFEVLTDNAFRENLTALGYTGNLWINGLGSQFADFDASGSRYQFSDRDSLVNKIPVSHAYYRLNPATAAVAGANFSFTTDYKDVTEIQRGYGQYTRAAANTAIGQEDPIITPVSDVIASENIAGGVLDVPYNVNAEKFVNTYVKNFVAAYDYKQNYGHTINGDASDWANYLDVAAYSVQAPFVAGNITKSDFNGTANRSVESDWAMVVPNLVQLIALADNDPEILQPNAHFFDQADHEEFDHWSKVDNGIVTSNHLYATVQQAIAGVPTHQVLWANPDGSNYQFDLKPFIDTHAAMFGAKFTRDSKLTDQELNELGLHYEYYLVDYTSSNYETSQSHHLAQIGDATSSIFEPRAVDLATGETTDKAGTGSIDREPIIRVELKNEAGDVFLVGFVKIRIVRDIVGPAESEPMVFDPILMDCPGTGILTWHQIERGVVQNVRGLSEAEFMAQYVLDGDATYGAKRFVKIGSEWYDEDSYIRMLETKYKFTDMTLAEMLKSNVDFAIEYFKAFAGRVTYTGDRRNYIEPERDDLPKETNVLVWQFGVSNSAWAHAFKESSFLSAQEDFDYTQYLARPDETTGRSTVEISTYVRFVKRGTNTDPIYVRLVVPEGSLLFAAGKLANKKAVDGQKNGVWFKLNSPETGEKEIHLNVPTPRNDSQFGNYQLLLQEDFVSDLSDHWNNNLVGYEDVYTTVTTKDYVGLDGTTVVKKGDTYDIKSFNSFDSFNKINAKATAKDEQENVTFYLTLPKKGYNAEFDADPATGTWVVTGWSGKQYKLGLYRLGDPANGVANPDPTKPDNYIHYERVQILAKDVQPGWKVLQTRLGAKGVYAMVERPVQYGTEIRIIEVKDLGGEWRNVDDVWNDILKSKNPASTRPAECFDVKGERGTWLVRLTEDDLSTTKFASTRNVEITKQHNKYIRYHWNWFAEDILNYMGHKSLGSLETFTAYLMAEYDPCQYAVYGGTDKYFNARFFRPVDCAPLAQTTAKKDAVNNGVFWEFLPFIEYNKSNKWYHAFHDWRDLPCWRTGVNGADRVLWSYYDIKLDNENGAAINYHDGTVAKGDWKFTQALLDEIRTDHGIAVTNYDGSTLAGRLAIEELPLASKWVSTSLAAEENQRLDLQIVDGKLYYYNNNSNVKQFNLYVPIHWSYVFGDELQTYAYDFFRSRPYTYAVIKVDFTQGNITN